MRRPVKPFVTEYRGGTRRQGAGGQPPKPDFSNLEAEPPTAEQRSPTPRPADPQEDGYEAALRAADALFSARKPQPPTAPQPGASGEPESATSLVPGGRVLRDLNEPTMSPELLRLEAERAPKRRGRKPGSKNKPKPVPPIAAHEAAAVSDDALAPAFTHAAAVQAALVASRPRVASLPRARRPAVVAAQAGDKYAWVRTKLKPGQQWKRRLPKVAW